MLRTALTLSMCRQKAFRITSIRKRRKRPGLQRQHLAAVKAAAEITRAGVEGAEVGAQELTFKPGSLVPGKYRFDIGTAGSTTLVAQTVLPALVTANGPSSVTLEGGTHNPMAPPFDYLEKVFCPLLNRMGPKISTTMERPGFYPRGGGITHLDIKPVDKFKPLELTERGKIKRITAGILLAHLPGHIAERERNVIVQSLEIDREQVTIRNAENAPSPGNAVMIAVVSENLTELFTRYGIRGVPAEKVAESAVTEAKDYLDSGVPVGHYLADQLLIPLALAGDGTFITTRPSLHATTNMDVIRHFTGIEFEVSETENGKWVISI